MPSEVYKAIATPDGNYAVLISKKDDSDLRTVAIADLQKDKPVANLTFSFLFLKEYKAYFDYVHNDGSKFYF